MYNRNNTSKFLRASLARAQIHLFLFIHYYAASITRRHRKAMTRIFARDPMLSGAGITALCKSVFAMTRNDSWNAIHKYCKYFCL